MKKLMVCLFIFCMFSGAVYGEEISSIDNNHLVFEQEQLTSNQDAEESAKTHKYYVTANSGYLISDDGIRLELEHTPYMQGEYLMLPLRDICKALSKVTNYHYTVEWIGGEDKIVEIRSRLGGTPIQISAAKNIIIFPEYDNRIQEIEGMVQIIDGTLYLPFTSENTNYLIRTPLENPWNEEKLTLTIVS